LFKRYKGDNGLTDIGVARRCTGCTCTPQGEEKNWGVIYRGKL